MTTNAFVQEPDHFYKADGFLEVMTGRLRSTNSSVVCADGASLIRLHFMAKRGYNYAEYAQNDDAMMEMCREEFSKLLQAAKANHIANQNRASFRIV